MKRLLNFINVRTFKLSLIVAFFPRYTASSSHIKINFNKIYIYNLNSNQTYQKSLIHSEWKTLISTTKLKLFINDEGRKYYSIFDEFLVYFLLFCLHIFFLSYSLKLFLLFLFLCPLNFKLFLFLYKHLCMWITLKNLLSIDFPMIARVS